MYARLKFTESGIRAAFQPVALALGIFIAQPSFAQELDEFAELLKYIPAQTPALGQAEQEAAALDQLIADESSAQAAMAASAKPIDDQIRAKFEEFKPTLERLNAPAVALENDWNNRCKKEIVGPLPPDVFAACQKERVEVEKKAAEIRAQARKAQLDFVGPKLLDIKRRQDKGLAELTERIKKNKERLQEARARAAKVRGYLGQARERLVQLCLEAADAKGPHWRERLVHCESIGWDGAKRNLPPLTELLIKPPFSASPN